MSAEAEVEVEIPEEEENRGDEVAVTEEEAAVAEGEGEAPAEEAAQEEAPAKPYMVPKYRMDSLKQRLEAAEARATEAEAKLSGAEAPAAPASSDETLIDIDRKQAAATAEGDYELAAKLAGQARALERELTIEQSTQAATSARDEALQSVALDRAIEELTTANPIFDPNADVYDQAVVDDVLALQRDLMAAGNSPSDALIRSVSYIIPHAEAPIPETTERVTNVTKNVDAANRQPPSNASVGMDSDKVGATATGDVSKLTEAEFDALPEATIRRMRGDMA